MGIKRIVDTHFWNDDKVIDLFSPEDKLFMLYLLTNPHTTQLGVYAINKKHMAFELGYSVEAISVLLDRFETKYELIKYSNETKEIAIKNYLRHSIVKGGKPVEDLLLKEISLVKDKTLLEFVYSNIYDYENLNDTVKKILSYLNVNEKENDNKNDNDNDNDVSYHDTPTNRTRIVKHKYGEYQNVLLSDEQYNKLLKEFPNDYKERIENLSYYLKSTGKVYKDHLATIRSWKRREDKQKKSQPQSVAQKDYSGASQFESLNKREITDENFEEKLAEYHKKLKALGDK